MTSISPDTSIAVMQASQAKVSNATSAIKNAAHTSMDKKELDHFDAVAKDFEAMFMSEMMKPMFAGIKPDKMFGGGKTEEVFQGLLLQEYGKLMAETGQIGIAKHVKEQLIRTQENTVEFNETSKDGENKNAG